MAEEKRKQLEAGDIIYWNGQNPDGTKEAPTYYVVMHKEDTGIDGLCLRDGDQNFFLPDQSYFPHFKLHARETIDPDLLSALPRSMREYHAKYTPKKS